MSDASRLIRQTRRAAGLTQAQLAARLDVAQPTVAALERPGANPSIQTLGRVLGAMGHAPQITAVPLPAVDEQQIRERLALSPAERLRRFRTEQRRLSTLRSRARRV